MPKNKQKYFTQYVLAGDCETTGLDFGDDPSKGHQAISWGLIVANSETFEPIEDLYIEIKWNPQSIQARKLDPSFGKKAETIHGLTFEYLEENGVTEEEATQKIANLILKYWGPKNVISMLGHNVHVFDMPFLRDLMRRNGVPLRFGSRHCDSHSLGISTVGSYTSDALFDKLKLDRPEQHNALDDAYCSLDSFALIKQLWKEQVGIVI